MTRRNLMTILASGALAHLAPATAAIPTNDTDEVLLDRPIMDQIAEYCCPLQQGYLNNRSIRYDAYYSVWCEWDLDDYIKPSPGWRMRYRVKDITGLTVASFHCDADGYPLTSIRFDELDMADPHGSLSEWTRLAKNGEIPY